jgi:hypothetical protein
MSKGSGKGNKHNAKRTRIKNWVGSKAWREARKAKRKAKP